MRQTRSLVFGLATALVLGLFASAGVQAAPTVTPTGVAATVGDVSARGCTATRARMKKRALRLNYRVSMRRFISVANHRKRRVDRCFDWHNNGCSTPSWTHPVTGEWNRVFTRPCRRHDFGYRNFGNGRTLASTAKMKLRVDRQFKQDMNHRCSVIDGGSRCRFWAGEFHDGVRHFGAAWTAFTGRKCLKGRFCLFDDTKFEDRRKALRTSEDDMNDINFGDKTSSTWNRTRDAWILYDDHDYEDTAYCLRAGYVVRDWDDYGFGDKTSSVKRLSRSGCPSEASRVGSAATSIRP